MKFGKHLLCLLVLCLSFGTSAKAEEKDITVFINEQQLLFDTNPVLEQGRTLVPLRVIFESLGATIDWIDETQTAVAKKDDTEIRISIDDINMQKNGETVVLDVPARMVNDRTMVPVRAVSEGLGAKVDWDDALWRVLIQSPDVDQVIYPHTALTPVGQQSMRTILPEYYQSFIDIGIPSLLEDMPVEEALSSGAPAVLELPAKLWNNGISQLILDVQTASESRYDFDAALLLTQEQIQADYRATGSKYGLSAGDHLTASYVKDKSNKSALLITFKNYEIKHLLVTYTEDGFQYYTARDDAELDSLLHK